MADERDREDLNQTVAEHVRQVRERLAEGRTEIERQRAALEQLRHDDGEAA